MKHIGFQRRWSLLTVLNPILPLTNFRPFVHSAHSSQIPQFLGVMALFGHSLPLVKHFAVRSPFLLHWIAQALLEIQGFVCVHVHGYTCNNSVFNCSPVCVCECICVQTYSLCIFTFWLCASTHRRQIECRSCFLFHFMQLKKKCVQHGCSASLQFFLFYLGRQIYICVY